MNTLWTSLLDNLALFLLQIAVLVLITGLRTFLHYAQDWLSHHVTLAQRRVIQAVADEAYVLAEQAFATLDGQGKLNQAAAYMQSVLKRRGIDVSEAEVRAAIEQAVRLAKQEKQP